MELNFKPGKFALNRDTLETVVVKDVDGDKIQIVNMFGAEERWVEKKDYNLFKRKDGKWVIDGPPIRLTDTKIQEMKSKEDKTNISERFK